MERACARRLGSPALLPVSLLLWVLAAATLWGLAVGLRPAAGADPTPGGTLVIALDQEPPTLDPHASPSAVTYQIIASVTESLLYHGRDGKLAPWLAESWATSSDGRSVTFKLRRDVKFHDGTPPPSSARASSADGNRG